MFNVWDRIEENKFEDTVTSALRTLFPGDPPRFMARTPHGYHDPATIRQDSARGGFATPPLITTLSARSRATSAAIPAIAYCQGTPLRHEILARNASGLSAATAAAATAIRERFGSGAVHGKIQALVVMLESWAAPAVESRRGPSGTG